MVDQVLMKLACSRVWTDAGGPAMEKVAVVPPEPPMPPGGAPPGGAPPMGPGAAGGMPPPMDPAAMAGGIPMDPAAMGGGAMPPGGGMPMDPAMMGGMPGAAPGMPMDPAAGGAAGQKIKPEQYMQMLDFRLYNLQQQLTTMMNSMDIKMDPGVLVTPPGAPMGPPPEAAMQGGPQDPGNSAQPQGGGGGSAISAIDPMQGASPELALGGGGGGGGGMGASGGEKLGEATEKALSFSEFIEKMAGGDGGGGKASTHSTSGDVDEEGPRHSSSPSPALRGPHPGVRPATQAISAGGSKDPKSRPETDAPMTAVNKTAAVGDARKPVGTPYTIMSQQAPKDNVAAAAAMMRSRALAAAR